MAVNLATDTFILLCASAEAGAYWEREERNINIMAAFSTNTNILSPSQPQQRRFRVSSTASHPVRTHSTLHFPVNNKYRSRLNTSTAVSPIFTAPSATITAGPEANGSASSSIASGWAEFAKSVSGEWDGFGADFTVEGKPIELPESVVPEAYREWEVKVFDWQTQCPTLAQYNNNCPCLMYKTIELLPTVGCEADAATMYSIQERHIPAPHNSAAFAYKSSGCYVAVWPVGNQTSGAAANKSMDLEHCLVDPSNKELRVRIIQVLRGQESEVKLVGIRVFVEQWYGPFRNGDQLGGCAIRDSVFAAGDPLKVSQAAGVWQGIASVANFHACQDMIQQVGDERGSTTCRGVDDLILLPKQLWCSVRRKRAGEEGEETWCEVGWLLDEGRAITSKCIFSSTADLKEIAIASETASPV